MATYNTDDLASMSDEEVSLLDPADFKEDNSVVDEEEETAEGAAEAAPKLEDEAEDDEAAESDDDDGEAEGDAADEDTAEDQDESDEESSDEDEADPDDEAASDEDADDGDEKKEGSDRDYKGEIEELLSPFKANGKEMQVDSVADARTLMMMGANYNKKMVAIKPGLKILKMLDNNGLMDEAKINYLIDLDKKDPQAIAKLLKISGIDPLDIDVDKDTEYKPNAYNVSDAQLVLDSALDDLAESPTGAATLEVIGTKWDSASRTVLASDPKIIQMLDAQMAAGVFTQISTEVEKQKVLGKLDGLSDLAAYKQVGDELYNKGLLHGSAKQKSKPSSNAVKTATSTLNKQRDDKLKSQKKAAAATKGASASSQSSEDLNPLSMSDADFEKFEANKFVK